MVKNTVMQQKNGQFIVTFPKAIATMIDLKKGDGIEWKLYQGDIIIRKC